MSVFFDRSNQLCSYLSRVKGLESIDFVADRQKDIGQEFLIATGKGRGLAVVTWLGGTNERESAIPRVNSKFSITVFGQPILRARGTPPLDDIIELVTAAVHHWSHDPSLPSAFRTRFEVTSIEDGERRPDIFSMRILAESITQFPKRTIQLNP